MRRIESDKKRIVEIDKALRDKSGREALRLLIKYDKEDGICNGVLQYVL